VILVELESAGELVLLRTEAFAASLEAAFGLEVEDRILHVYGGNRYETAYEAMVKSLSGLRDDGHYVLSAVNAETLHGAVEALKMGGVWSRERFVAVTFGDGEVVDRLLADGLADGAVISILNGMERRRFPRFAPYCLVPLCLPMCTSSKV